MLDFLKSLDLFAISEEKLFCAVEIALKINCKMHDAVVEGKISSIEDHKTAFVPFQFQRR